MSDKPSLFLLVLLALLSQSAYSNPPLYPGYYIDLKGDTVLCRIEYNDWYRNPATIVVEVNNTKRTLGTSDIKGFGVTGYGDYQAATVNYHLNPIGEKDLPDHFLDDTETKTCFLKVLVRGPYSLYQLILPERLYFFLSEKDGAIAELVYRVKQEESGIVEDQPYKSRLGRLYEQEGILVDNHYDIEGVRYSPTNLVAIVNKLNEARTGVKTMGPKAASRAVQVNLFAGGVLHGFPTTFAGEFNSPYTMPSSFSLAGGVDFRLVIPGHFNVWSIGLSVGYDSYNTSVSGSGAIVDSGQGYSYSRTTYTETIPITSWMLTTNLYAMYLINKFGTVQAYVKGGVGTDFLLGSNINMYTNYSESLTGYVNGSTPISGSGTYSRQLMSFRGTLLNFNASLGAMAGRSRIELSYYTPMELGAVGQPSYVVDMFGIFYYCTLFK
jgi:hypothetical protein